MSFAGLPGFDLWPVYRSGQISPGICFCDFVRFFVFDFFTWFSLYGSGKNIFVLFCTFLLHVLKTCLSLKYQKTKNYKNDKFRTT